MTLTFLNYIILLLLILPIVGILILLPIEKKNSLVLKKICLANSAVTFVISLFLLVYFNKSVGYFQYYTAIAWLPFFNINLNLGVDGISIFFIILTTMLITLCLLVSWNSISVNLKEYLICFLILEFFLIGVFCVLDLMLFYVLFESVLIPMYLIIGVWGSRERKIRAAFFFLYTPW